MAIVAVTVISGEYSTGMIRLTLTATPSRWRVLTAKGAVVGAATLVAGAVAVLASVLAGGCCWPGTTSPRPTATRPCRWAAEPCWRRAVGAVPRLIALLSLGVAAAVRDSAVAIGVVLALLFLSPSCRA